VGKVGRGGEAAAAAVFGEAAVVVAETPNGPCFKYKKKGIVNYCIYLKQFIYSYTILLACMKFLRKS
jgi:hypothetical protein